MRRSIPPPVTSTAKPLPAIPAASSSPFCRGSYPFALRQQIHIILDNLSAHKTQAVREFLQQRPRVRFHFTPTYSSWLNQVEIWFAKIEREVIARGIFTSVSDLARKLRRYINAYSANARPIQWKYSDPTRRVRSNEITATSSNLVSKSAESPPAPSGISDVFSKNERTVARSITLSDAYLGACQQAGRFSVWLIDCTFGLAG